MSLAGPSANLLIAVVAFVALRFFLSTGLLAPPERATFSHIVAPPPGTPPDSWLVPFALLLSVALNLNVLLGLFNLIPLPPLDGAGVVEGLFPQAAAKLLRPLRTNPMLSILGLLAAWRLFGMLVSPAFGLVLRLLHPGVAYS